MIRSFISILHLYVSENVPESIPENIPELR